MVHITCKNSSPKIPEHGCSDCDELEERVEALEECCEDVHEELDNKADESDLEELERIVNGLGKGWHFEGNVSDPSELPDSFEEGAVYRDLTDGGYYVALYDMASGGSVSDFGYISNLHSAIAPIHLTSAGVISHDDSGVTAGSKGDTTNQTPDFGDTVKSISATVDAKGHVTALNEHTVKIPDTLATQSDPGLMSPEDKEKVDNMDDLFDTVCGNPAQIENAEETELQSVTVALTPHQAGTPWQSSLQTKPYMFQATPQLGHNYNSVLPTLVGGSVAWNQLLSTSTGQSRTNIYAGMFSEDNVNITSGHKYLISFVQPAGCAVYKQDRTNINVGGYKPYNAPAKDTQITFIGTGTATATESLGGMVSKNETTETAYQLTKCQMFDLTAMFGSTIAEYINSLETANAGAGVAWFKKLFPKPYYAYNAGELMSVQASAHNTVGFNAFDVANADIQQKAWENIYTDSHNVHTEGYTKVIGGATYCFHQNIETQGRYIRFYDADYSFLQPESISIYNNNDYIFTVPANAMYLRLMWYDANGVSVAEVADGDICINLHWDGERDGEYEEYVEHEYPLDSSLTLRGIPKLDASNNLYYDGDTYEADGTVTRKYAEYTIQESDIAIDSSASSYENMTPAIIANLPNGLSSLYKQAMHSTFGIGVRAWPFDSTSNIGILMVNPGSNAFWFGFAKGTTLAQAKSALTGTKIVYELATPTTEEADPYQNPQIVDDFGTEEYVDGGVTASTPTRDVAIPVGQKSTYADIYEITGTSEIDLYNRGINQWDEQWELGGISSVTGITYNQNTTIRSKNFCPALPSTQYYIKTIVGQYGQYTMWYDKDKNFISAVQASNTTITSPANARYFKIQPREDYGTTYNHDISINVPSTDHDYHAYLGADYTASLGTTVYGGDADLVKGQGQKTYVAIDLGSLNYTYNSTYKMFATTLPLSSSSANNILSDRYPIFASFSDLTANTNTNGIYKSSDANHSLYIRDLAYTVGADLKTALNGVYLIYELATPTDYTFTAQDINAVTGQNNVWSEQGDVCVTYLKDRGDLSDIVAKVLECGCGGGEVCDPSIMVDETLHATTHLNQLTTLNPYDGYIYKITVNGDSYILTNGVYDGYYVYIPPASAGWEVYYDDDYDTWYLYKNAPGEIDYNIKIETVCPDPSLFYVTLSYPFPYDGVNDIVADKTMKEIYEAYLQGRQVIFRSQGAHYIPYAFDSGEIFLRYYNWVNSQYEDEIMGVSDYNDYPYCPVVS